MRARAHGYSKRDQKHRRKQPGRAICNPFAPGPRPRSHFVVCFLSSLGLARPLGQGWMWVSLASSSSSAAGLIMTDRPPPPSSLPARSFGLSPGRVSPSPAQFCCLGQCVQVGFKASPPPSSTALLQPKHRLFDPLMAESR